MSCKKYQDLLETSFNDELDQAQSHELEEHLKECPECDALARSMSRSVHIFTAMEEAEPALELSPYFARRIAARAAQERSDRRPLRLRLGLAFGTLLVLGLLGGYLIRPYLVPAEPEQSLSLRKIRFQSGSIGVEIGQDHFILHSKDRKGKNRVDLKL